MTVTKLSKHVLRSASMKNKNRLRPEWGRYIGWAALIALGIVFMAKIYHTLMLFGLALLIAYLLHPLVTFISRMKIPWSGKKIPRYYSIILVYLLLASLITILGFILIPNATEQIANVIQSMPGIISDAQKTLDNIGGRFESLQVPPEISKRLDEFLSSLTSKIGNFIEAMFIFLYNFLLSLISGVLLVMLSLLIAFFMLSGEDKLKKNFYSLIPTDYQDDIKVLLKEINSIFGKFIRGTTILIFIYGALTYTMFQLVIFIMQFIFTPEAFPMYRFALIASVVAGILSFIPYVGCILIVLVAIILAMIQHSVSGYVITIGLIAFVTNQMVDTLIKPKILGKALGVPTIFVLFSIFAAGEMWGAWGLLIGIPLGVMLIPIIKFYHKRFLAYDLHKEVEEDIKMITEEKNASDNEPETSIPTKDEPADKKKSGTIPEIP
jgi:predicted PurR-regulated permease PerM